MKRLIYLILVFSAMSSLVLSQSITITHPHNGAIWQKNVRHEIRWDLRGEMNNKVKIRLFNWEGTTKIKDIVNNKDNDGTYRCPVNIFNNVPEGEYKIRVKTIDNRFFSDSNIFSIENLPTIESNNTNPITIPSRPLTPSELLKRQNNSLPALKRKVKLPAPSIIITHPPKDYIWDLNLGDKSLPFPIRVMWKKTGVGSQDSRVKIYLWRIINPGSLNLTQDTANDGLFRGEINRNTYGNLLLNPYTIKIITLDGKIEAESERFYIKNASD